MSVLLWSAILYTISSPLYHKIIGSFNAESRFFRTKCRVAAAFFSVGTVILVAGISFFFVTKLIGQGQMLARKIMNFFISKKVDMLITHHPIIFKAIKDITEQNILGKKIRDLIKNDIDETARKFNRKNSPKASNLDILKRY